MYICGNDIDYIFKELLQARLNQNLLGTWCFVKYSHINYSYNWEQLYESVKYDNSKMRISFKNDNIFEETLRSNIESTGTFAKGKNNTIILRESKTLKIDTLTVINIDDKFLRITKSSEKDSSYAFIYAKEKSEY